MGNAQVFNSTSGKDLVIITLDDLIYVCAYL